MVSFSATASAMEDGSGHVPWSFSTRDGVESDCWRGDSILAFRPQERCLQCVRRHFVALGRHAGRHPSPAWLAAWRRKENMNPDLILHNGRIATLDPKHPEATNLAVKDGRIVGVDDTEEYERGPNTKVINLKGRRVIPGLNDSHLHVIRGGLNYNMELRWDGVPSLAA